jgi:cell division protein FtsA
MVRSGYDELVTSGVVVTGGSSILPGVPEIVEQVFNMPARVGYPANIGGLKEIVNSPMYATAVGLVLYGANSHQREKRFRIRDTNIFNRIVSTMKRWFTEGE